MALSDKETKIMKIKKQQEKLETKANNGKSLGINKRLYNVYQNKTVSFINMSK